MPPKCKCGEYFHGEPLNISKEAVVNRKQSRRLLRMEKVIGDVALWVLLAGALYWPFYMLLE